MKLRLKLFWSLFVSAFRILRSGDPYRWRSLAKEVPPHGARVDLHANDYKWQARYFGMVTIIDDMCLPCSWSDGDKGRLVLEPRITTWRYSGETRA